MGVSDGTAVDAATTNPAFLDANADDTALGKISFGNVDVVSGPTVTNIQREINSLNSFTGRSAGSVYNSTPSYTNNEGFTASENEFSRIDALSAKFKKVSGHNHDGTDGNGQKVSASSLDSVRLRGFVIQAPNLTAITGSSVTVTTDFSGKVASSGDTVKGVVVLAPNNRVIIRQGSGANQDDAFLDGFGNVVYGRLTESTGVWTLSFFVMISAAETAYSFSSSSDIKYYYQELFNPIVDSPVYSEYAVTPSENSTQDVVDATATQRGLVSAGTQSFGGNKTFTGTVEASNLSGTNTGDITLGAVGSTPNANGASLSGQVLTLQPVDASFPGVMTTGAQTIPGSKTFTGDTQTNGSLIVNQRFQALTTTNSSASGSGVDLSNPANMAVRLTNPALVSINGVLIPRDGQVIYLINETGVNVDINNNIGGATSIYTGTGLVYQFKPNSMVALHYSTPDSRWHLFGAGGGGSGGGEIVTTGSVGTPQSISATGIAYVEGTNARQVWFVSTAGGEVDVTTNPQIAVSTTVGRELWIYGTSDSNYIILQDGNGLSLKGDWYSYSNSILKLMWNGSAWAETGRV